jgi:hypothetical protein
MKDTPFEPIPPVKSGPIPPDAKCQEASIHSREFYIPCSSPAVAVVRHEKDRRAYYMCHPCADHNIRNRGGVLVRKRRGIKFSTRPSSH